MTAPKATRRRESKRRLDRAGVNRLSGNRRSLPPAASLYQSDPRLRNILENLHLVAIGLDVKGRVEFANPFFLQVSGYSREEVIGRIWLADFVPARERKAHRKVWAVVLKGEGFSHYRSAIVTKNGQERTIDWNNSLLRNESGAPIGVLALGEDVTERKRVEEALRESQDRLSQFIETVPDGIYMIDRDGHMTFANQAAESIFRAKREQLKHLRYDDKSWETRTVEGEPFPDEEQPYVVVMKTGKPVYGVEQSVERPDGTRIIVSINAAPLHDSAGQIVGEVGVVTDITQRKQLEDQLQHIKDYLETLIDSANDIVYTLDAAGHFTFTNRRAEEATGYTSDQWIGKHFLGMIAPEDRAGVLSSVRDIPLDEPQSLYFRLVTATGEHLEVSVNTTPIFAHGQLKGTLCIARDMTEKNRLEGTLREERDRLNAILRCMAEGVLVTDSEYRLILMNRAAEDLIGIPHEHLIGQSIDSITLPITRADLEQHLHDANHEAPRLQTRAWGSRSLELFVTTLRETNGRPAGTVTLVRDITDLRRVDQMKSEFISLVSHELRTPLTSVKGYTDLILAGDAGPISAEQNEFLGVVKNNVDHLILMINDLLDISRIEAGRIKLLPASIQLTPLVGEIIRLLRPQCEAKSQIIFVDIPKSLPPAFADRDRLSQILGNLLSNALKYSPSGTRIKIRVTPVEANRLTSSNPDLILRRAPLLEFSVEDEGIGIEAEDQEKLFTKFYRVDNSLTREIGGTGLGLAIVKSFVEMHGGRVWVSSPLDPVTRRGSCFTFTVPAVEQADSGLFS